MSLTQQRDIFRALVAEDFKDAPRPQRKLALREIVAFLCSLRQGV